MTITMMLMITRITMIFRATLNGDYDDDDPDDDGDDHDDDFVQGDTERLAKFKIRIEDPPRRKDMVILSSLSSLLSSTLTESSRHGGI